MKQATLLPLLYDAQATGGWSTGMVRVTLALLAGYVPPPGAFVLEVGCGLGAVVHALQAAWPAAQLCGVELHPLALAAQPRRAPGSLQGMGRPTFVQANLLQLPFAAGCADLLLALDAFDQVGVDLAQALAEARRVLRPGGMLLLRVSAHPRLQGAHDVAFNTGRRYTRAALVQALGAGGFALERVSYANLLLAAPAIALRTAGRWGGSHSPAATGEVIYSARAANAAIQAALTREAKWLRRANLPAGLSLLVRARAGGRLTNNR